VNTENTIAVCCAVIGYKDTFLATQRSEPAPLAGKWEFPGGKVKKSETVKEAVIREINEELGILITPIKKLPSVIHHYPEKSIHLIPYQCTINEKDRNKIYPVPCQWLRPQELTRLPWCAADIPIVELLIKQSQ